MKVLIGFAGPKSCGKTTAARMLGDMKSTTILSFAAPMKKCLMDLFGFTEDQMYTYEGKEAVDPRYGVSPRTVMQQFGTEFIRTTVPDLWCILMSQAIEDCDSDVIAIDDLRFEDEAELVGNMGGTVVHIQGRGEIGEHKSEQGLDIWNTDLILDNSGSLQDLQEEVSKLLRCLDETD